MISFNHFVSEQIFCDFLSKTLSLWLHLLKKYFVNNYIVIHSSVFVRRYYVFMHNFMIDRFQKTKTIRRIAIAGSPIVSSLDTPVHQSTIVLSCLRWASNWAPIMPRNAGLLDFKYVFFFQCSPQVS